MQTTYVAGDAVFVHDGPFWAAAARGGQQAPKGRSGIVDREMPYDPGSFQVSFSDGLEPSSAIVTPDVMVSPADLLAGTQAAAELAARVAAVAGAHAAATGQHAEGLMAEATRLAAGNATA